MSNINVKFQAYIPKSLGKPLIQYFENDWRFRPELVQNYQVFKQQLKTKGKGRSWLPEPGNPIFSNYFFSTDSVDSHENHLDHDSRLSIEANFKPEKIGSYSSLDKNSIFSHSDHSYKVSGTQHSGLSHRIKAHIQATPFYDEKPSSRDMYVGICEELETKRSEEKPLKFEIKNLLSGSYIHLPSTKPKNETTIVKVSASAGYPFLAVAPNIDFELKIMLFRDVFQKKTKISISGSHNNFPAYKLIVDGAIIYSFNPSKIGQTGPGLINLNTSMNFESKTIWKKDY